MVREKIGKKGLNMQSVNLTMQEMEWIKEGLEKDTNHIIWEGLFMKILYAIDRENQTLEHSDS